MLIKGVPEYYFHPSIFTALISFQGSFNQEQEGSSSLTSAITTAAAAGATGAEAMLDPSDSHESLDLATCLQGVRPAPRARAIHKNETKNKIKKANNEPRFHRSGTFRRAVFYSHILTQCLSCSNQKRIKEKYSLRRTKSTRKFAMQILTHNNDPKDM